MLLVTKNNEPEPDRQTYAARFLMPVAFVPCVGARNDAIAKRLSKAFQNRSWTKVKSLRRANLPDRSCWFAGDGWWLSTN